MTGLLILGYVLGPPAISLAVCRACTGHCVLLWLGGVVLVGIGACLLVATLYMRGDQSGEAVFAWGLVIYGSLPFLAAGLVLLIGGFVRWGKERRAARGGEGGGSP